MNAMSRPPSLRDLTPSQIAAAITEHGTVTAAARALGIDRGNLRRKARLLGIESPGRAATPAPPVQALADRLRALVARNEPLSTIARRMSLPERVVETELAAIGLGTAAERAEFRAGGPQAAPPSPAPRRKIALPDPPPRAADDTAFIDSMAGRLALTGGRYADLTAFAKAHGLTFTQAQQRWFQLRQPVQKRGQAQ